MDIRKLTPSRVVGNESVLSGMAKATSVGSRIFSTVFGLLFAGFAVFMFSMILRDYRLDQAMLNWIPVDSVITTSEIATASDNEYAFMAEYQYSVGGHQYAGSRFSRNRETYTFEKISEKSSLLQKYPRGIKTTCYVNPSNPQEAVLQLATGKFPFAMVLFLIPFVLVGLGIAIGPWFDGRRKSPTSNAPSITGKSLSAERKGKRFLFVFGLVFTLVGAGISTVSFRTFLKQQDAAKWIGVDAVVLNSAVRSNSDSDGTTYYPYVAYSYTYEGRDYEGDRYDFWKVSSSGYSGKAAVVAQYPKGRKFKIFIDPIHPEESVINPKGGMLMLLPLLLPLVFLVVGLLIMGVSLKTKESGKASPTFEPSLKRSTLGAGTTLRKGRSGSFFGTLFFAVFWNGIVSVFLYHLYQGFLSGQRDWFLLVFMTPFVLIGLVSIGGVFVEFLRLFNPKVELVFEDAVLAVDRPLRFRYRLIGAANKVSTLQITLQGCERVTFRSGKSTSSQEKEFYSAGLLDTSDPRKVAQGQLESQFPEGTMHTFKSEHYAIVWKIKVQGVVAFWPDIRDEHVIDIQASDGRQT